MKGYIKLRKEILEVLKKKLSPKLTYHALSHTLDVLKVCNQYITREKIDSRTAKLLRIGALLHDIGFTVSHIDHEQIGAEIAQQMMQKYNFSQPDIDTVKGLILATKIPQSPKTHLEKIICDADLDYLGRMDFPEISEKLFQELKLFSVLSTREQWNRMQIKFLEAHRYHTEFAQKNRQPHKEKRISVIKCDLSKG
ncbi:HD domain-containing protein [Arenibacter sp. GZD96]|uniref:HD domain-containing protein n=1 Tax=Aurantibrevibacter litoralis TaxID=3106030 RepID=UPI002AFDEA2E|nr:HD domain-containing protein [Arenibacter sp. GZD-96]MEA1786043.1 HD domain-containing protein [Arenibacter sp. GZD-96]